jgi:uncharacterized paraquat-inducible protein A
MRIELHSLLECPECDCEFSGTWVPDATTADQTCPACGHVFTATWKGWDLPPERVIQRAARPYRRPHPSAAA